MNIETRMCTPEPGKLDDWSEIEELNLSEASQPVTAQADPEPVVEGNVEQAIEVQAGSLPVPARRPSFDYNRLGDEADMVREAAARIHSRFAGVVGNLIEIGKDLLAVKHRLPHGEFGRWLQAEFGWTERTAQNYMNAAREFGDRAELVAELQPTALYKLGAKSTPEEVRATILEDLAGGLVPTAGDISSRIEEARTKHWTQRRPKDRDANMAQPEPSERERQVPEREQPAPKNEERNLLAAQLAEIVLKGLGPKIFSIAREKLKAVGEEFLSAVQALDSEKAQVLYERWRMQRENQNRMGSAGN